MRASRIMADLRVRDIEATKTFYTDFLVLATEEFNVGWVARYTSPDTGATLQLVTHDATAPEDPVISLSTSCTVGTETAHEGPTAPASPARASGVDPDLVDDDVCDGVHSSHRGFLRRARRPHAEQVRPVEGRDDARAKVTP